MTSEEAVTLGGLDYEVVKQPIYFNGETGNVEIPGKFATVRTDIGKPLGVVGSQYTVIQNRDAFSFFNAVVDEGEAMFETAGALGDGERIFVTAKIPAHIEVAKELVELFWFLYNSHDGSGSLVGAFTPVRVVCNNTLNAALRTAKMKVSIRHTQSANERLKEAHKMMGLANKLKNELTDVYNAMAKTKLVDSQLKRMITEMVAGQGGLEKLGAGEEVSTRMMNMIDGVYEYALSHPTNQTNATRGTMFGAYNAVTGYYQNAKEYADSEKAFIYTVEGTGAKYGQKMFDLCLREMN